MTQIESINAELNRLFDVFNFYYYDNEIEKPVITVQTNGKSKGTMGWCSCKKIWKNSEKNEYYYEITICGEYLYRSVEEICSTLLHEMVHLYCIEHNIKDTSRSNIYHNKKFKEVAEQHGLIIEYDKRIGWSITKLTDEAKTFVKNNANKEVFVLTRITKINLTEGGEEEGPKQSMRKYVCPRCGAIIRATKNVNVLCTDCNEMFVLSG
jgi:hypothetical protein